MAPFLCLVSFCNLFINGFIPVSLAKLEIQESALSSSPNTCSEHLFMRIGICVA